MPEAGNERQTGAAAALRGKRVLLVIAGGIAAYKCLDLIRRLRENGAAVRCILTQAGAASSPRSRSRLLTGNRSSPTRSR